MLSQDEAKTLLAILNQLSYKLLDAQNILNISRKLQAMTDQPTLKTKKTIISDKEVSLPTE
jgi:hypothetical protein